MVGGAMALPEGTRVAKPPRINFTEDNFYPFLSCYICSGEFGSVATFEAHMEHRHQTPAEVQLPLLSNGVQ